MSIGADVGTYNLVCSRRNKKNEVENVREVNAFIEIPLDDPFTFKMMKQAGVPLIQREKLAYAIGEAAVSIAGSLNGVQLKRPMSKGCVNPNEKSAFQILKAMIHGLIGEVEHDGEIVCYTVPANAINETTDADYHQRVLKGIFDSYEVNGKKIRAIPINEALALVYAELGHKMLTGISVSFGGGMTNVCYANMSIPVFTFALVNSGDWIDERAAKATGESIAFINKEKEKIDLLTESSNPIHRAIQMQYRIMIDKTVRGIKEGFEKSANKVRSDRPLDVIIGGGTASPAGFEQLVRTTIDEIGFPIQIGDIIKPKDHLYSVAKGCLIAAERSAES